MSHPLRVLHAPALVGGNAPGLARAERAVGLHSEAIALVSSRQGYAADGILSTEQTPVLIREARKLRLLRRALRDFDVVHLNFGTTIASPPRPPRTDTVLRRAHLRYTRELERVELELYRRWNKPLFITYQGDDARQTDICAQRYPISPAAVGAIAVDKAADDERRRAIDLITSYADGVYALNPDLLRVLPDGAQLLPYAHLDLASWRPVSADRAVPRLVHAPTDRAIKGTPILLDALETLRGEGVRFELDLVEHVPFEQARARYAEADLLVDQLLVGWYGGLAVELMALGKPVICYLRDEDLPWVPEAMRKALPIIPADPTTLVDVLRRWLTCPSSARRDRGMQSRRFVEDWHDPLAIARRLKHDYEHAFAVHQRRGR